MAGGDPLRLRLPLAGVRKNRLGDAITAHAITNFLLGVYIVWRGAWKFW